MTNYKHFDLEAARRGEPVVTRKGFEARIICFDHTGQYPIVALLKSSNGAQETIQQYRLDGSYSQNNSPYDLFMAAPAIPEGFTAYDPNVPPPENAEEIEMVYALGGVIFQDRHFFAQDWEKYNGDSCVVRDVRTHYRVTKWKEYIPEGFTAYDPNVPPPENADDIEYIGHLNAVTFKYAFGKNVHRGRDWKTWGDFIKYYRVTKWKEAKPNLDDVIDGVVSSLEDASLMCIKEKEALTKALNQFADAIVQRAVDKIREDRG